MVDLDLVGPSGKDLISALNRENVAMYRSNKLNNIEQLLSTEIS
jgi:hypothetical protein